MIDLYQVKGDKVKKIMMKMNKEEQKQNMIRDHCLLYKKIILKN